MLAQSKWIAKHYHSFSVPYICELFSEKDPVRRINYFVFNVLYFIPLHFASLLVQFDYYTQANRGDILKEATDAAEKEEDSK